MLPARTDTYGHTYKLWLAIICLPSFYLMSFFFTSEAVYAGQSSLTLVQVAKVTIDNHFSDHPKTIGEIVEALSKNIHPSYRHSKGLFITLSKHGKTRACWGQISGTENNLGCYCLYHRRRPHQRVPLSAHKTAGSARARCASDSN